jgi:hypothetical protein
MSKTRLREATKPGETAEEGRSCVADHHRDAERRDAGARVRDRRDEAEGLLGPTPSDQDQRARVPTCGYHPAAGERANT